MAAYRAVREAGFEAVVSFVTGPDGNILSGETLAEAAHAFEPLKPLAVCVNCIQLPTRGLRNHAFVHSEVKTGTLPVNPYTG